jgi:hypothetical protein
MQPPAPAVQYIYEPLSYDHDYCQPIRLLRILPGEPDSPISCEVFKTYVSTSDGREKWKAQAQITERQVNALPVNLEYVALVICLGRCPGSACNSNRWQRALNHQKPSDVPPSRAEYLYASTENSKNILDRRHLHRSGKCGREK